MKDRLRNEILDLKTEIEMLEKYISPLADLNIKANLVSNSFISCYIESLDEIQTIIDLYKPIKNHIIEFTGRESLKTNSPFVVCVNNYTHIDEGCDEITIKYSSDIDIWINIPIELLSDILIFKKVEYRECNKTFIAYETRLALNKFITYNGGELHHYKYYIENESDYEQFLNAFKIKGE